MVKFEVTCRVGREPRLDDIRTAAAQALKLRGNAVINVIDPTKSYQPTMVGEAARCYIVHRSIDARGDVLMRYRIEAYKSYEQYEEYKLPDYNEVSEAEPVIVVGAGPAGLFAALKLLTLGLKPIIIERGKNVHKRKVDIAMMSRCGVVDPDSNYCYGEGGAGTFSDGKLYTRSSKRGDIREVLHQFVRFGADPSILIDAHPHIGTDKLPKVIQNIRETILEKGGEYHFETKVVDIVREDDGTFIVKALNLASESKEEVSFKSKGVILAAGHSSKEIFEMCQKKGWSIEAKGFALGVRVEHSQELINNIRYHGQWEPGMPAAEYSFVEQIAIGEESENEDENNKRGVFSFCMCPGGILVPTATEDETIVLNGMSNSARNSKWANSGVVVSVEPEDVPEEYQKYGAFSLLEFQHDVEKKMFDFIAGKREVSIEAAMEEGEEQQKDLPEINPQAAPAQRMIDFCNGVVSHDLPESSYHPGVISAPLHLLLPDFIVDRLQKVFPIVNKRTMRGYFTNDALLLGVESRTSSPVRIVRDEETYQSPDAPGLFPCGEGSGYSGGIVSSALDGINCAVAVAKMLDIQ